MEDLCFWSIGDGPYAAMLQALVNSFHHVGMENDFHVLSDRPIIGAKTHLIQTFDKTRFQYKMDFLMNQIRHLPYRYFVYMDADTYFTRRVFNLLDLVSDTPIHVFLETNLLAPYLKRNWWGQCSVAEYIRLMRDKGITHEKIYNVNGGFFILEKEAIPIVYSLMLDFWDEGLKNNYAFSDEPPLAYAMHKLTKETEKHLLVKHLQTWAVDWMGVFSNLVPFSTWWNFIDFFTLESTPACPAIIHAIQSKKALQSLGESLWKNNSKGSPNLF
jgi:hypothetical protein